MLSKLRFYALFVLFVFFFGCSHRDPREERYLFSLDSNYENDLQSLQISKDLLLCFERNGHPLSSQIQIEIQKENEEWTLCDKESKQEYIVVKKDNKLHVYRDAINLEKLKETRTGMDYRKEKVASLFQDIDALLKKWLISQKQEQPGVNSTTTAELAQMVRGHFTELVEGWQSKNQFHRMVASAALGFSNDIRCIPYLLEALVDSNASIRSNAALSLGQIEFTAIPKETCSKTMSSLRKAFSKEPDDDARAMMAFAISQIISDKDDYGCMPLLMERLKDPSPKVRNNLVMALGKLKHPEAAKAIIANTIEDKIPVVRYNSIRAISQIGKTDGNVIPSLIQRMRDPVPIVAAAAYHVLKNMTGKDFGPDPKKWEEWAGMTSQK